MTAGEAARATIPTVSALTRAAGAALDLAFPAACSGCGREGEPLCATCLPALDARLDLPGGTPIGLPADLPAPLLQLEWCAPFAGPVRHALHDLKYAGERRLATPLGAATARRWRRVGVGTDLVVPVPVHEDRERHRGYDQAALIAAVAARDLRVPVARALLRGRATIAQFELGRDQRAANVAGAFRIRDGAAAAAVRGRWILLVDDVVTTGSTLAACAAALEGAGARAVSAITVARER
jgi:ComF family protein